MLKQQWLTVGVSTLIAGTIASVILPSKPIAVVAASTAGAVGGMVLATSQRSHASLYKNGDRLTRLENIVKQTSAELVALRSQLNQAKPSILQRKETAIFYDIENLLKGYNFSRTLLVNLSLNDIVNAIQATEKIGHVAIQKAYANWSDPRLRIMRREINELGIDPIQVFGFSREPTKNAADIQLVIDAVNVANLRSSIDVFVIVSGDGGFASLAKHLHEYGKTVIGCAYRGSTSKTFQAVCDDFVWINDPEQEERQHPTPAPVLMKQSDKHQSDTTDSSATDTDATDTDTMNSDATNSDTTNSDTTNAQTPPPTNTLGLDPRNARLVSQLQQKAPSSPEETVALTREILNWYANDPGCRLDLSKTGIYLSVVEQGISHIIPGLQTVQLGLPKFVEYMQYVCKDSELCIIRVPPSKVMLALRNATPEGSQTLPDLDIRDIHSVDTYRSILETGRPIYRIPVIKDLHAIATWVVEHPMHHASVNTMTEAIVAGLNGEIPSEIVKQTLFSLLSAGAFIRASERIPASEQILSLRKGITSLANIVCILKIGAAQKLSGELPYVNEEVLQDILPDVN